MKRQKREKGDSEKTSDVGPLRVCHPKKESRYDVVFVDETRYKYFRFSLTRLAPSRSKSKLNRTQVDIHTIYQGIQSIYNNGE